MNPKEYIKNIIAEELTHSERDELLKSREFQKRVKEITADVLEAYFKEMWTKRGIWKNSIK